MIEEFMSLSPHPDLLITQTHTQRDAHTHILMTSNRGNTLVIIAQQDVLCRWKTHAL